jgi:hypothetical protein
MNCQECVRCKNSYFTLEITWLDMRVDTKYICESCNLTFVVSNCTSTASAPDPSYSNQLVVSVGQAR